MRCKKTTSEDSNVRRPPVEMIKREVDIRYENNIYLSFALYLIEASIIRTISH